MNQDYFEKISDMMKQFHEPMQSIAELNVKTLQSYSFIKPEEFSKITKPDELLEKQFEMAISNGHKALDYMQKYMQISFQILEKAALCFAQEAKTQADGKNKA